MEPISCQRYQFAKENAGEDAVRKCWTAIYMARPELLCPQFEEDMQIYHNARSGVKTQNRWKLITLNPKDTGPAVIDRLQCWADDIKTRSWLADCEYIFEAHNKKGQYTHPHCHMIFKTIKPKSQLIRELTSSAVKHYLEVTPQSVDVKLPPTKDIDTVRAYLTKFSDGDKYPLERIWRKKHKLQNQPYC